MMRIDSSFGSDSALASAFRDLKGERNERGILILDLIRFDGTKIAVKAVSRGLYISKYQKAMTPLSMKC